MSPALAAARRALRLRKGPPTQDDTPPVRPFPGRKIRTLPGQLDFEGNEAQGDETAVLIDALEQARDEW